MENKALSFVGIYTKGYSQEYPDVYVAVDSANEQKLVNFINTAAAEYDSLDKPKETRLEYIIIAVEDSFECQVILSPDSKVFL